VDADVNLDEDASRMPSLIYYISSDFKKNINIPFFFFFYNIKKPPFCLVLIRTFATRHTYLIKKFLIKFMNLNSKDLRLKDSELLLLLRFACLSVSPALGGTSVRFHFRIFYLEKFLSLLELDGYP